MIPKGRQLSLFGVEARPPNPYDLEGLLAGTGQVTRMGGTARVSIEVDEAWRAAVLRSEARLRGLVALVDVAAPEPTEAEEELSPVITFRTAYSAVLAPLADRWLPNGSKEVPRGFALDGRRLRLWVAAGGAPDGVHGFRLKADLDLEDALATVGLPVTVIDGAYKIVGRKRLSRLAELIGEPPPGVPPGEWPV